MSPARLSSLNTPKFFQTGQGIIEIVVVLALAAILILALVALSVRSNRSANFAKAEDQAARLSQEGMEAIKQVKQSNASSIRLESTDCYGAGSATVRPWSELFDFDFKEDCGYSNPLSNGWASNYPSSSNVPSYQFGRIGFFHEPSASSPLGCNSVSSPWCVYFSNDGYSYSREMLNNREFHRFIYIADTPTNLPLGCVGDACGKSLCNLDDSDWERIKQFTVVVVWNDTSGDHSSITTSCLTR